MEQKRKSNIILVVLVSFVSMLIFLIFFLLSQKPRLILKSLQEQFNIDPITAFQLSLYSIGALLVIISILTMLIVTFARKNSKKTQKFEKLYRELKKKDEEQNKTMSLLIEIGESLSSVLSKTKLVRLILENFIKFVKTASESTAGMILLYQFETGEFVYESGYDIDKTMLAKLKFDSSEEIISQIVRKKQFIVVEEIISMNHFLKKDSIPFFSKETSLFIIPLVVENNVMGIINLFCNKSVHSLINDKSLVFSTLVKEASIALGSAVQSELAIIDRLTRLYNRGYFLRCLEQEIERCKRYKLNLSLLMLDVDHFKTINDTYGHQQGDMVLAAIAKIIKDISRIVDFCARYGGEEFVVILTETELYNCDVTGEELKKIPLDKMGGAITKAERLRKIVEESEMPGYSEGVKVKVTVSIGIGTYKYTDEGIGAMELIRQADEQLYQAKRTGRNKVCYPQDLLK